MKRSERVQNSLDAKWMGWGVDYVGALSWVRATFDQRRGEWSNLTVRAGEREVQVSVSPTGRSVRVFVDGVEAKRPQERPAG